MHLCLLGSSGNLLIASRNWHLSISIDMSIGMGINFAKVLSLTFEIVLKNKIFKFNTPQYSFLCLAIRHCYHFAVTHFSTISMF